MRRRAVAPSSSDIDHRAGTLPERRRIVKAGPAGKDPLSDDVRLFALTFVGGFLFMAVYLG